MILNFEEKVISKIRLYAVLSSLFTLVYLILKIN